jgi:SAM-dependent methyltransferase
LIEKQGEAVSSFTKLSLLSRQRKIALFYKTFQPTRLTRILDVGAEINPDGDRGLQLIDSYPWKRNITALNLSEAHVGQIKKKYPEVNAITGDACRLPWPDKHFDVVYSNAVIEHVGDLARQQQMATEIMRVGKRWFVSTPNRWYPFEFHLRLPFVTWLGGDIYLHAARLVRYNHARRRYDFINRKAEFRLLSLRDMKTCFPGSRIVKQRITFMAETLIALGGYGKISWGENGRIQTVPNSQGDHIDADPRLRAMSAGVPQVCGDVAVGRQARAESFACESS